MNFYIIKRGLTIALMSAISSAIFAQSPVNTSKPTAIPLGFPTPLTGTAINYVRTWEPSMPIADTATLVASTNTALQVKQTTQYIDGLGRPIQSVGKAMSPAGFDVVTPVVYDPFGRTQLTYLPYIHSGVSDGNIKTDPFSSQSVFYKNAVLNPGVADESIYYSQSKFEPSPLNRVTSSFSQGNNWAAEGGNRPVQQKPATNANTNSIRVWNIPANGLAPVTSGIYSPGQLTQTLTIDEQGQQIAEFKDKYGRIILKKVSLTSTADDHTGWLCTYYVYDDLGKLRCIIPPKAVDTVKATWVIPTGVYDELCFRYTYDGRNRMVTKKLPGKALEEMVYDVRDRVVYSRDGNLRGLQKWMVTFYDVLNRPIETALYADTSSITTLQNQLTSTGILNPPLAAGSLTPQTYTYYDDYSFTGAKAGVTSELSALTADVTDYPEANTISNNTKDLVTGTKVLVIGTSTWLTSTTYYDSKGRIVQTLSDNLQGGQITNSNLYSFSGKTLRNYVHLTNPRSTLNANMRVLTAFHYDAMNRMTSISKQLNDDPTTLKVISQMTYDELGNLKTTVLGNGLDYQNLTYNIKGWLTGINKDYVDGTNSNINHFGEVISYDNGFSQSQYNGNISGLKWKGFSDITPRAFGTSYDHANRLLKADFTQQNTGSTLWTADKVSYSVSNLAYDANGNITSMAQAGMKGPTKVAVDYLSYKYLDNSNKLLIVRDTVNDPSSTLGDFKESAQNIADNTAGKPDYSYDVNGNLTTDGNKGLTYVAYNYLNLPDRIQVNGKGSIAYLYDASGTKLRKTVSDSTGTPVKVTVTDYVAGMIFQNDTLQLIDHEQGRIRALLTSGQPVKYVYDYFIKDHLGSIRQILTERSDTAVYAATMEPALSAKENALFSNIDNTRQALPAGYPTDNTTNPNAYVSTLNAQSGKKIGASLVLRVMAGDTINIATSAFYKSTGASTRSNYGAQMISALLQAFSGAAVSDGPHAGGGSLAPISTSLDTATYNQLLQNGNPNWSTNPKAYLNFVIFDDQFNLASNSGVRQVQASPNALQQLVSGRIVIQNTGFIYIYTSNESAQDVNFDNLVVSHISGPLLEETHYYPFGLTMAGISSHALLKLENRYKYNGIELDTALGINEYEAHFRDLDPQTGRWWQIDPKVDQGMESISPYASMYNDPCRFTDFMGDKPGDGFWPGIKQGFIEYYQNLGNAVTHPVETLKAMASPKALLGNALNTATMGQYDFVKGTLENVKTVQENGVSNGLGQIVGKKAGEVSLVIATDGAAKGFSAVKGVLTGIGKDAAAVSDVATQVADVSSGGTAVATTVEKGVIADGDAARIGNAANRIKKPISVVGSRASGTAKAASDWDYVIEGLTNKEFKKIKNSLPGAASVMDNTPSMIDIFKGTVDKTKPHVTINPSGN